MNLYLTESINSEYMQRTYKNENLKEASMSFRYIQIVVLCFFILLNTIAFANNELYVPNFTNINKKPYPFITQDKCDVTIVNSKILVNPDNCSFIFIRENTNKKLIKIPESFIDKDNSDLKVKVSFKSIIFFKNESLYVEPDTTINARNYKSKKLNKDDEGSSFKMERKMVNYDLTFISDDYIKNADILKKDIVVTINQDKIKLKYNQTKNIHSFKYAKGLKFDIKLDNRFKPGFIPYATWSPVQDQNGSMEGKFKIDLSSFDIKVSIKNIDNIEVNHLQLISNKQKGIPKTVYDDNKGFFMFRNLKWKDEPFKIKTSCSFCAVEPLQITLTTNCFDKIDPDTKQMQRSLNIMSYVDILIIRVVNSNDESQKNLLVYLELENKSIEDVPRRTDTNGEVSFRNIYDWKNSIILIKRDDDKTVLVNEKLIHIKNKMISSNSRDDGKDITNVKLTFKDIFKR